MQLAGDVDLAAALASPDQDVPRVRLLVDWGGDGTYSHPLADISGWCDGMPAVSRALTGDLPVEASQVEGSVAATLSATLAGEVDGRDAVTVFSPHREDSPLWRVTTLGVGIRYDSGIVTDSGVRWIRRFTGNIRSLRPESGGSRQVVLKALDPADKLRALVSLPVYALRKADLARHGRAGIPWSTNSTWVVDYILRRNGVNMAPGARGDAILSVTNCGGLAAEIGYANGTAQNPWQGPPGGSVWTDGPFGGLAGPGWWDHPVPRPFQEYYCSEQVRLLPGAGFGISEWAYAGTGANGDGTQTRVLFELIPSPNSSGGTLTDFYRVNGSNSGRFSVQVFSAGLASQQFFFGVVKPAAWRYVCVFVRVNDNATVTLTCRADGATSVFIANLSSSHRTLTWYPLARAILYFQVRAANHQVWLAAAPPVTYPDETHVAAAVLGRGGNELDYLPDEQNAESWDLLKAVAEAEYATIGFDEFGVGFFRARGAASDPSTVEKEITADRDLVEWASQVDIDSVRNVIGITCSTGYFGDYVAIIDSKNPLEFESPVGVWEFPVTLPPMSIGPTAQSTPAVTAAQWQASEYTWGFVAVRTDDPTVEVTSGVGVDYVHTGGRTGRVTVRNYSEFPVRFQLPGANGQAALRIAGYRVEMDPDAIESVRSEGSVTELGQERAMLIPASAWRQRIELFRGLIGAMLPQLANAYPVIEGLSALHDPRLQLGDTVRLRDPGGLAADLRATVVKTDPGSAGTTDSLTVRPVAPPGLGIWDDPELGIWDDTLTWAP